MCKDIATLEREDRLLCWLPPVLSSLGLKSPQNGCDVEFVYSRANGEEEGRLEGGPLAQGTP